MDCHLVISSCYLQRQSFSSQTPPSINLRSISELLGTICEFHATETMNHAQFSNFSLKLDSFFCARATDSSHLLPLVTLCKSHNILARDYHSWVCQHENGQYISVPKCFPCSKARYFQPEHILQSHQRKTEPASFVLRFLPEQEVSTLPELVNLLLLTVLAD